MKATDFDQRYADQGDPWNYRSSDYERAKYAATLAACGTGPFTDALELAGSIGVFSAMLAPRCAHLTTIDFSEVAVGEARRFLADVENVDVRFGEIPAAIDAAPRDLVVASEILYYLEPPALAATLVRLEDVVVPAGRVVGVHWRPAGPERPFSAADVHDRLDAQPWLTRVSDASTDDYLLTVWERS